MKQTDVVVIGAGPSGLACAGLLQREGISVEVIEKTGAVGSSWRNHYERLHLHTSKGGSNLPGRDMPADYPRYPSRQQIVEYLENYADALEIQPSFNTIALSVSKRDGVWQTKTDRGNFASRAVIVATGAATNPQRADWPGLESFNGTVLHSEDYVNTAPFTGQKVLVVGFGNSGGEIALDLSEANVDTALSVRSPVRALPRDLLGLPIQTFAILQSFLPYKLVDAINAPVLALAIGSYKKLGLRKSAKGAMAMINEDGRIPILDIGTLAAIRRGKISVFPGIDRVTETGVEFSDGRSEKFDAIIMATGYRPDLRNLITGADATLDNSGFPLTSGETTSEPGLYFCGYRVVPTGVLREIGIEAQRLAEIVKADLS